MESAGVNASDMLRAYRIGLAWRIFIVLFAVPLIGLFVWVGVLPWTGEMNRSLLVMLFLPVVSLAMIGVFVFGALDALRSVLYIYPDRIVKRGVFATREIRIEDMEGFRLVPGKFLLIVPKPAAGKKVKVSALFENFREIITLVAQICPDLDAREAAVEEQAILNDREFGDTDRDRSGLLRKTRTLTKSLNAAAVVVALWAILFPTPYEAAVVLCAFFPIVGVIILTRSKGMVRFDERRNSAHPSITAMFVMPSIALALRALLDFTIIDAKLLLMPVAAVTGILSFLMLRSKEFVDRLWLKLLVVLFVAVYAYGLTIMGNCLFDRSRPESYTAEVLKKRIDKGKTTTYHVTLAPWGTVGKPNEVSVDGGMYDQIEIGAAVYVWKKEGMLHIPWYFITLD